ncbi:hypothetical protein LOZ58_006865 [Ophidiomyces ophidiicola]|nr:hypothetical protein LOZ58_006865 [Ophidiomyces ophidiicola]
MELCPQCQYGWLSITGPHATKRTFLGVHLDLQAQQHFAMVMAELSTADHMAIEKPPLKESLDGLHGYLEAAYQASANATSDMAKNGQKAVLRLV